MSGNRALAEAIGTVALVFPDAATSDAPTADACRPRDPAP